MDLKTYWLSIPVPQRPLFAQRVGLSLSTLNQAAFGRKLSLEALLQIENASYGMVRVEDTRPDLAEALAFRPHLKAKTC
jgi:DNA-binding transcriptional regulator YdaS (Cro superfamily)